MTESFIARPEWRYNRTSVEFDDRGDSQVALAWEFAQIAHRGQMRKSGEPYDNHLAAVYGITTEVMGLDYTPLKVASVLHDVVEDQEYPGDEKLEELSRIVGYKVEKIDLRLISEVFGEEVAFLVDGVTKFGTHEETLRKVLLTSEMNPLVALIKLADRCHNMSTLEDMPRAKQIEKARETMNVYVPLAESLGMWMIKNYLEDLSFKYLEPERYAQVVEQIDRDPRLNSEIIVRNKKALEDWLDTPRIDGHIEVRVKGYWEAEKKREKLIEEGNCQYPDSFEEVGDLVSYRIILDDIDTVYVVIGRLQMENADRTVDSDNYIKVPADNGYSAGHEVVMTDSGLVELAVTTRDREDFNNFGVLSLIRGGEDISGYVRKMVLSPNGKMHYLPKGATGVDYAMMMSSELLARAVGIKIDGGKVQDIRLPIPNATRVEVVTDDQQRAADPTWVSSCVTRAAKQEIKRQQERLVHEELIEAGKLEMERLLADRGLFCLEDLKEFDKVRNVLNVDGNMDQVYARLGAGTYRPEKIIEKLDGLGIVKDDGVTRRTSIRIFGPDIAGTIAYATTEVKSFGGSLSFLTNWADGANYEARLVIHDLTEAAEAELIKSLNYDRQRRFEKIEVV